MKKPDFNKYSSALKERLKSILRNHELDFSFRMSKICQEGIKDVIAKLKSQEERFADFVIRKQKEIDGMQNSIVKSKMQEHLDKIAVETYQHFNQMIDRYQKMMRSDYGENSDFIFSNN